MKAKKPDSRPAPTKKAAAELGLTRRRIRQMRAEGSLDNTKEMARLRRLEKEATIKLRGAQEEQIRADLQRKARLDAEELIHADVAVARFVGFLAEIRAQLQNLPERLAYQLRPDDVEFAEKDHLGRAKPDIGARAGKD